MPEQTKTQDNIVRSADGQPIVPFGSEKPLGAVPKDTLPRPTPQHQMPSQETPQMTQETVQSKAVQGMTTFEELAAKKGFQSPDDLAKSYIELESQNKRVEASLSDAMKARQQGIQNPQQRHAVVDPDEARTNEDAVAIVKNLINEQLGPLKDSVDYQFHLLQNPADKEFATDAIRYVQENPGISWQVAFKAAKADHLITLAQREREQGRQEGYQGVERKNQFQTQSAHSSQVRAPEVNPKDVIDGIRTGKIPLSEARKFINNLSQQ